MGGALAVQTIAALSVVAVPVYGVMFGFYSMNAFEILLWAGAAYVVVVLLADEQPRFWLLFGLLVGIGLQNKHSFVLFATGLVLGLLLHRRSAFRSRWLWLGGLLALIIFLPNLVWQVQHDWPTLEFYAGAAGKNIASSPVGVILDQLLTKSLAAGSVAAGVGLALTQPDFPPAGLELPGALAPTDVSWLQPT
jgi:4-amino-4-deoxy-L-arabinose transferase-like glycosyltransferase